LQIQNQAANAASPFIYSKAQTSLAFSQPSWITGGNPSLSMLQIQNQAASAASSLFYSKSPNYVRTFHKNKKPRQKAWF